MGTDVATQSVPVLGELEKLLKRLQLVIAGGTSDHGVSIYQVEVTEIFATRATGTHHWLRKDRAAQAIVLWLSKVKELTDLRRTDAPEVSWKDVQTPTGYQDR